MANPENIFATVNSITKQALGNTAITATNSFQLIAMGDAVLSTQTDTNNWINALCQRIGKTIFTQRAYSPKFKGMVLTSMEMGTILQKISIDVFEAETDESTDGAWNIENGDSIDMYKVNKPTVVQGLFNKQDVYKYHVSIPLQQLRSAFLSVEAMGQFLSYVTQAMTNSIEFGLEQMNRICITNYVAQVYKASENNSYRVVKLLTNFNEEFSETLTAENAMTNPDFVRYVTEQINLYTDYLTDMNKLYNDGTVARHTPKSEQKLYVLSKFEKRLETIAQYAAFHKEYISLNNYETVNYWQSAQTPATLKLIVNQDGSTTTTINNLVAVLADRFAFGSAIMRDFTLTTPVNANGAYYNMFHHVYRMWVNDLSENGVIFVIE